MRHLQVQAHELQDYEVQIELVLRRYLRRLQWLLGTSRRTFGVMVEKKVSGYKQLPHHIIAKTLYLIK